MTAPAELAARSAYLSISREVLLKRYGRDPRGGTASVPEALQRRIEGELREYAALRKGTAGRLGDHEV